MTWVAGSLKHMDVSYCPLLTRLDIEDSEKLESATIHASLPLDQLHPSNTPEFVIQYR